MRTSDSVVKKEASTLKNTGALQYVITAVNAVKVEEHFK